MNYACKSDGMNNIALLCLVLVKKEFIIDLSNWTNNGITNYHTLT